MRVSRRMHRSERADGRSFPAQAASMIGAARKNDASIPRRQTEAAFDRTVREPEHKDLLTGIVKAEATTWKRSAITIPQQYRWHMVRCRDSNRASHCAHHLSVPRVLARRPLSRRSLFYVRTMWA